jgi:hypothetical protein
MAVPKLKFRDGFFVAIRIDEIASEQSMND